jgi:hypothetical protein
VTNRFLTLTALAGLAAVAGASGVAAAATGAHAGGVRTGSVAVAAVPVLGASFAANQKGFGRVRPASIDAGGDPTGIVEAIRWQEWGGRKAIGTGRAEYLRAGQSVAQGTFQPARIVASELGTCRGRRAYREVQWYFPAHGGRYGLAGNGRFAASEMCAG